MPTRAERRHAQDEDFQANARQQEERPNIPPRPAPVSDSPEYCGASRNGRHDFSMRGPDKRYRCWYCCRLRTQ